MNWTPYTPSPIVNGLAIGLAIGQSVVGGGVSALRGGGASQLCPGPPLDRRPARSRGAPQQRGLRSLWSTISSPTTFIKYRGGDGGDCGTPTWWAISENCLPSAFMFFGVYCTTMYELVVLVSTHALRTGKGGIPLPWERALYLAYVRAGVAALLGVLYYLRCAAAVTQHQQLRPRAASLVQSAQPGVRWISVGLGAGAGRTGGGLLDLRAAAVP